MALFLGLVAIAVSIATVAIARSGAKRYAESNRVVPGVPTRAPASWAGEHSAEARMHRRLRDAVAALAANPEIDRLGLLEARLALEQQALSIDERLVAVAALPERVRVEPLAKLLAAVEAVEEASAQLASTGPALDGRTALDEAMVRVEERVALLTSARAELDAPERPPEAPGPTAQPG